MRNLKSISFAMGIMLLLFSCSTEPNDVDELNATNLKSSDDEGCETGFAVCAANISTCFIDSGFNRWGWTIGPLAKANQSTFGIYIGAGQCDLSKGKLVGNVVLDYNQSTGVAVASISIIEGYGLKETHLYIGDTAYPMVKRGKKWVPTVAPGQFPYKHDNLGNTRWDQYTIEGLSGEINLIAHAVVCKDNI